MPSWLVKKELKMHKNSALQINYLEVSAVRHQYLLKRAYAFCVHSNSHVIAHDLFCITESELMGVINFPTQLQGG